MAGKKPDALKSVKQGLAMSKANVMFAAARVYLLAGDVAQAGALSAELSKQLEFTPQAFGKLIDGDIQLSRGNARQAVQSYRESERLADSWLSHFDLARAYIAAEAYTDASTELETCLRRRGEATDIYIDETADVPLLPGHLLLLRPRARRAQELPGRRRLQEFPGHESSERTRSHGRRRYKAPGEVVSSRNRDRLGDLYTCEHV